MVEFLLDHGVSVSPITPKARDRARDRSRMSSRKRAPFEARVRAEFLRTDHGHRRPPQPNTEAAQARTRLTRDYHRVVRQQTRLLNQLAATRKEYDPRPPELFVGAAGSV